MKQTKRMLGLLLALVLVAAMCVCPVSAAEGEKTVTVRVELMDSTLIPPTEVTMPATHQTFADFGMSETDPGFDTPIHALAQYLVQEGYSEAEDVYEILEVSNKNLSSILYLSLIHIFKIVFEIETYFSLNKNEINHKGHLVSLHPIRFRTIIIFNISILRLFVFWA